MDLEQICKSLKETRQEKKLSLKDVSNLTRLTPLVLKRIEEGENLEKISQFYLKGFLKIYASSLGRNDLLEEIEKYFSQKRPISQKIISKKIEKSKPSPTIPLNKGVLKTNKKILYFLTVILLLILTLALFILNSKHLRKVKKATHPLEEKQKLKELPPPPPLILKPFATVMAKAKVLIEVKVDGKLIFREFLLGGNKESWEAKNKLEIKIWDPSSVSLEIGGKIIPTSKIKKPTLYVVDPNGFQIKE